MPEHQANLPFVEFEPSTTPVSSRVRRTNVHVSAHEAARQLDLRFSPSPSSRNLARERIAAQLGALLRETVTLTVTDNRRTMISSRRRNGQLHVRLHHMFLDMDDDTLKAVARYLWRGDRRAGTQLNEYITRNGHRIRARSGSRRPLRTAGRYHDLRLIYDELNLRWFDGEVDAGITWGRAGARRGHRRRTIRLGTYDGRHRVIRIHPVLDQQWVPHFFVAYIVFHEMLHHIVPAPVHNGRRQLHSPEFRARERIYPDYQRALRWEREHIDWLLRS